MLAAANSNARTKSIDAATQGQVSRVRDFRTLAKSLSIVYLTRGGLKLPHCPVRRVPARA